MERMCALVTYDFFEFIEKNKNIPNIYEDYKKQLKKAHEHVREEEFLEEIFDKESKITKAEFCNLVSTKTAWLFESSALRKKVFAGANVRFEGMPKLR